jgi:hypothetical protein
LVASIYLVVLGTHSIRGIGALTDLRSLWSLGVGSISAVTIIDWAIPSYGAVGLISNLLVANASQVVLSIMYFTYNGLFTSMFLASEWDGFSQAWRGLRVSRLPSGAQRSSYFLQLPYKAAVPLMAVSGLLHWLVSQSGFLIDIEGYEWDDQSGEYTQAMKENNGLQTPHLVTCGFSPMAMVFVILLIAAMVVAIVAAGFRRFRSGMPVASSCSLAISAACHPVLDGMKTGDLDRSRLRWVFLGLDINGAERWSFLNKEMCASKDGPWADPL